MSAVERLYEALSGRGPVRGHPEKFTACCPAHDDGKPSLSVQEGRDGDRAVVNCFAGCTTEDILSALGMTAADLFDEPRTKQDGKPASSGGEWTPHGDAVAVYDYRNEAGDLLFQVLRTADKQFPQRRPDPTAKSGWRWNLGDTRRVLYRLPELIEAINDGKSVCIAEGEKDVEALRAAGRVATCNPGGAGKWRSEYAGIFAGCEVTIFADKDKPGQAHARAVAESLDEIASKVWIVEAADPHKDIAAQIEALQGFEDCVITVRPDDAPKPVLAPDLLDLVYADGPEYEWLVPGLLEVGDRVMITGKEGLGKSMLVRQLAVAMGAGIHPFNFSRIPPLRVLVVDCENSVRQNRRTYRPIIDQTRSMGRGLEQSQIRIIHRPEGIDLPGEEDAAWLLERVTAHAPQLLVIGPLYRLHLGNPNNEDIARRVVAAVDAARNKAECAVLIETHSGHGEIGKPRPIRPTGSSLYLRWPEFGYGLRPVDKQAEWETDDVTDCDFRAWRGARDERDWPTTLTRLPRGERKGTVCWPWTEYVDESGPDGYLRAVPD